MFTLLNNNVPKQTNILYISNKDRASTTAMMVILENLISYPVHVFTNVDEDVADLIISDVPIQDKTSTPAFLLSYPPRDSEIAMINHYIKRSIFRMGPLF